MLAAMMREAAWWLADPATSWNEAAPASARTETEQIILGQDHIRSWVEEETEPSEAGTRSRSLYKEFIKSCREAGIHPSAIPTETRWGRRLTELGHSADQRRDGNYRPLRIRSLGSEYGFPGVPPSAEVAQYSAQQVLVEGSPPNVDSGGGSAEQPSTPDSPSSDPSSSTTCGGLEGIEGERENNNHIKKTPYIQPQGGNSATTLNNPPKTGSDLHVNSLGEPSAASTTLHTGSADSQIITQSDENEVLAGDGLPLPDTGSPSNGDTATQSDNGAETTETGKSTPKKRRD